MVNAANNSLLGGAGVDGAIHRAAGRRLFDECKLLGGCDTGSAKITDGYKLGCKVIHAVGPKYYEQSPAESEQLLRGCYRRSLELAAEYGCKTIAFSAISTGVYSYPILEAAATAISEVGIFLRGPNGGRIERVVFCSFMSSAVTREYNRLLPAYVLPEDDDLGGETWSRNGGAGGVAEEKTRSESLAASLPHPPTTEPKAVEEPFAKKQKVAATPDHMKGQGGDEDEFEDFPVMSDDGKDTEAISQNINDGWEDVGKDKEVSEHDSESTPLDDEPVDIEGTKEKMAKVLEADGEVASKAPGVPNMLTRDW